MRHDSTNPLLPRFETLESRRLMAVTALFGGECLPRPTSPGGGTGGGVNQPPRPQPNPNPTPTPNPGHGGTDHGEDNDDDHGGGSDDGGTDKPTPVPDKIDVVLPKVIGNWSGAHATPDKLLGGNLSLEVRKSKTTVDELTALVDFTGPQDIRWSGQLLYDGRTGHLTMYYLSSKLVAKMDATLVTGGQAPRLVGTVEYFTKDGSYKASFTLLHGNSPVPKP